MATMGGLGVVLVSILVLCGGGTARAWIPDPTLWGPWQAGSGWLGHFASASHTERGWFVFSNVAPIAGGALCPGGSSRTRSVPSVYSARTTPGIAAFAERLRTAAGSAER